VCPLLMNDLTLAHPLWSRLWQTFNEVCVMISHHALNFWLAQQQIKALDWIWPYGNRISRVKDSITPFCSNNVKHCIQSRKIRV
jgi:hypothetical protein